MKTSCIAAVTVILLAAGRPTWAAGERLRPADVLLSSTSHGEVVIPVFIGSEGPYRFLLDTGSSHTAISQTLATALGAVPIAKTQTATSVGSIVALVVRLPAVAVGSAQVESLQATALPPEAAGWLGDGLNGVIGQDFLSQFDYTLDFRTSRLSWNSASESEKGIRLALESSRGRFLVHLPQDDACRCPVRLVPDSGAGGLVLFTGTEADRLPIQPSGIAMRVSTLAGTRNARGVTLRELRLGSATLSDVPATRIDRHGGSIEDGDGLLPLSLFARVAFHHLEGYMVGQPK